VTDLKAKVGEAAVEYVEDGMRLGIGTGSTAEAFVRALAPKVSAGLNIIGVPTSIRTHELCMELGVPLTTLEETPHLDLTIDGADEIDPKLALIKGAGGALLREKVVAMASDKMMVIADTSKIVKKLGVGAYPLPIEVTEFGLKATCLAIEKLAGQHNLDCEIELRGGLDKTFVTDGGHFILDTRFGPISDPQRLCASLNEIAGVMENGLFVGIADIALIAGPDGVATLTS